MNTKRFFAAIFAAAILSISFLACDPKEDDPTTNPTPSTDVVKEIYGYYGKTTDEVVAILDQKGWTKSIDSASYRVTYTYLSSDSLKSYEIVSYNNYITGTIYTEREKKLNNYTKATSNTDKFISLFEKWENSLSNVGIATQGYFGKLTAEDHAFNQHYNDRMLFLENFNAKKSSLNSAISSFFGNQMSGECSLLIDTLNNNSCVSIRFMDNLIIE